MLIRKASAGGNVYNINRRYTPQDHLSHDPKHDEMKVYVLDVVDENVANPEVEVRKVRCSIEAQAWLVAVNLNPTDDDLVRFYADRIADTLSSILTHPTGDTYIRMLVDKEMCPLWLQYLGARRAGNP